MMKKWLLSALLPVMGIMTLSAQEIVTGKVTDKHGAPIPGARVEAKGGTETTLTELDGTFRLETKHGTKHVKVDYVGMQSRTQRKSANMEFVLSKTNLWNREPLKQNWLIALEAGFPESSSPSPSFGLMFGRVRNFGWYVKGLYRPAKETNGYFGDETTPEINPESFETTGKVHKSYSSVTAGCIARLGCALHFYVGAGYGMRDVAFETVGGKYVDTKYSDDGMVVDYGLMLRLGRFLVHGGTQMFFGMDANRDARSIFIGNVGVGVCF